MPGSWQTSPKMEMHRLVWGKKASFSCWKLVNLPKNGDAWTCMGEKGFIFMLEAGKPPQKCEILHLYGGKRLHFHAGSW
jgi:hypothetical protein